MEESTIVTSLSDLKKGDTREGDSGITDDEVPPWFDQAKFQRGQDFFRKHIAAIALSMHCSLVSGFSIINLLEPLVFTNASDTPEKSYKRYVLTAYHIVMWMTGDVWDQSSNAYKSLKTVRGMHKSVAKRMKQVYTHKLYVSQYDMGLVQSGFFAAALMYPRNFGIRCTEHELDDYIFVWRVLGYCLGIEDEYNICRGKLKETKALVREIEQKCLIPALKNPPKDFDKMVDAYIDGANKHLPLKIHSKKSILSLVWDGFGRESPYKLSFGDHLRYYHLKFLAFLMYYVPGFKNIVNYFMLHSFEHRVNVLMGDKIKKDYITYSQY